MPSYDFRCKSCGHQFTVKVGVNEKDKVQCPVCQSKDLSQLFTAMNYFRAGGSCGAPAGSGLRFG